MSNLFIGVDGGGTQTRSILATAAGDVIGVGRAAGANSWSSGTSVSDAITAAVRAALGQRHAASVTGGVVAVAGGGASSAEIATEIDTGWGSLGLPGSPDIVPDVLAAYAAGTTEPRGVVLAAGTGAIAALISQGAVESRSGGHGWLVGDEGSGVWLGRKGTQAALQALDGRGSDTMLATAIPEALDIDPSDPTLIKPRIVNAIYGRPPAYVGELAPVIIDACERGDPVARGLVEAAADHLARTAFAAMGGERPAVVVLAGSVLTQAVPINRLVRARLADTWPAIPMTEASSGEAGAVALAIARHGGTIITDAILAALRSDHTPQPKD